MRWHLGVFLAMIFGGIHALYIPPNTNIITRIILIMMVFIFCDWLEEKEW